MVMIYSERSSFQNIARENLKRLFVICLNRSKCWKMLLFLFIFLFHIVLASLYATPLHMSPCKMSFKYRGIIKINKHHFRSWNSFIETLNMMSRFLSCDLNGSWFPSCFIQFVHFNRKLRLFGVRCFCAFLGLFVCISRRVCYLSSPKQLYYSIKSPSVDSGNTFEMEANEILCWMCKEQKRLSESDMRWKRRRARDEHRQYRRTRRREIRI